MGERQNWATDEYRIDLTEDRATDFVRVRLRIEQRSVVRFTVQYETVDGQVHPGVRYDAAQATAHRDRLDLRGHDVKKSWMPDQAYADIVTGAIAAINASWHGYRSEFLRRTA